MQNIKLPLYNEYLYFHVTFVVPVFVTVTVLSYTHQPRRDCASLKHTNAPEVGHASSTRPHDQGSSELVGLQSYHIIRCSPIISGGDVEHTLGMDSLHQTKQNNIREVVLHLSEYESI